MEIAVGTDEQEVRDYRNDDDEKEEHGPRKQSCSAIRLVEPEHEGHEREP